MRTIGTLSTLTLAIALLAAAPAFAQAPAAPAAPAAPPPPPLIMSTTAFPDGADIPVKFTDRKSTRLNSSHIQKSRMPSSA